MERYCPILRLRVVGEPTVMKVGEKTRAGRDLAVLPLWLMRSLYEGAGE